MAPRWLSRLQDEVRARRSPMPLRTEPRGSFLSIRLLRAERSAQVPIDISDLNLPGISKDQLAGAGKAAIETGNA